MENLLNNPFLTLGAYIVILTIYLAIVPLSLFYWMNNRWNVMGKFERLGIYGLVFLFFPGLILFSPFLTLGAYIVILTIYLAVVPLSLFYWMNNRWNVMGKFERLGIYGLVFLFFPGLILFSPFLNLRLNGENKG